MTNKSKSDSYWSYSPKGGHCSSFQKCKKNCWWWILEWIGRVCYGALCRLGGLKYNFRSCSLDELWNVYLWKKIKRNMWIDAAHMGLAGLNCVRFTLRSCFDVSLPVSTPHLRNPPILFHNHPPTDQKGQKRGPQRTRGGGGGRGRGRRGSRNGGRPSGNQRYCGMTFLISRSTLLHSCSFLLVNEGH